MGYPAVFPTLLRWLLRQPHGSEITITKAAAGTGLSPTSVANTFNHALRTQRISGSVVKANAIWVWNGLGIEAKACDHELVRELAAPGEIVTEQPISSLPKLAVDIPVPSEVLGHAVGRTFSTDAATAEKIRSGALQMDDYGVLTNAVGSHAQQDAEYSTAEKERRARHRTVATENAQGDEGKGTLYEFVRLVRGGRILLADEDGNLWVATALPLNGAF